MRAALTRPSRRAILAALAAALPACAQTLRDLVAEPDAGFAYAFSTAARTTGWLALEGRESLILAGRLNGLPVRVLLDSGAGASLVDVRLAQRLGLRAKAARRVEDGSGLSRPGADLADAELVLGSLRLTGLHTVAVDLPTLIEGPSHAAPLVVLGREAFERLWVEIDGPAGRLAFHAPGVGAPPAGARPVPLLPASDLTRRLSVSVEGADDLPAQFDLGSQSPLVAQEAFAQSHGWLAGRPTSTWIAATVAGVRQERTATVRGLALAGSATPPVPLETIAAWDRPELPVVLGLPVFSRFRLMTDYAHDRLWLAPDAQALGRPFRKDRSGLALRPVAGGLEVLHVAASSPASAGGWRIGETIVAVDGHAPGGGFGDGPPGRTFALTLAGGGVRRLTLAEYS